MQLTERQRRLLDLTFIDYHSTAEFLENPLVIDRAEGLYYWDTAGKRYFDSIGGTLARTIGDEAGRFSLLRPRGSTRLHIVRIGFRPRELALPVADTMLVVRLEAFPALLAAVSASSNRTCPGDHDGSHGFELWEQARAALLASVVAREAHPPRVRLISYTRTRDPVCTPAGIRI